MANKTLLTLNIAGSVTPGDLLLTRQVTDTSDKQLTVDQLKLFTSSIKVSNGSGVPLVRGDAVCSIGYDVGNSAVLVSKALANSDSLMPCIGLVESNIGYPGTGYVSTSGTFTKIDTSVFSALDKLYVSSSVSGKLQNVEPSTYGQLIGQVINVAVNGTIEFTLVPEVRNYTGTGTYVKATGPTLTSPVLGTPTSGILTNCTGLPEGGLALTDLTTNNASGTKHGFCPKLSQSASSFLDGTGQFSIPAAVVNGDPYNVGVYNYLDNPDFTISQAYGSPGPFFDVTGSAGTISRLVDRWIVQTNNGNGIGVSRVGSVTRPFYGVSVSPYQMRFANGGTGNNVKDFSLIQRFTGAQARKFTDALTIGFLLRCHNVTGSNIQWSIIYSTPSSLDSFITTAAVDTRALTATNITEATWSAFSASVSGVRGWSNLANGLQVEIRIKALSSDISYEACIADVMLCAGSTLATFRNPTITESELRCFPFYQKTFPRDNAATSNTAITNGALYCKSPTTAAATLLAIWKLSPSMRVAPSINTYSYDNASSSWSSGGVWIVPTVSSVSDSSTVISATTGTTVVGTSYAIHASADAQL